VLLELTLCVPSFAAKKDFKGLFGSYRREKFTENEARSTSFGVDFMLSTLFPLTPIVSSAESRSVGLTPLSSSSFFNFEASFFLTLNYNFELFANVGIYTYETRKENTERNDPSLPLFHLFEMDAYPMVLGVKYRLSTDDIVPYIGAGMGLAYVRRKGFYDNSPGTMDQEFSTVLTGQVTVGLEFFFSSNAGIRLESSAMFFKLPERTFDPSGPSGNPAFLPILSYQANPWLIRYASGIFVLF